MGVENMKKDCAFCSIVNGTQGASKVFESGHTLAFMNQRQANPGHVLVIPKRHFATIYDLDDQAVAALFQTVVRVSQAIRRSLQPDGLTIWQSNGEVAGQEIFHVHIHIFPRVAGDPFIQFYPELPAIQEQTALDQIAKEIRTGFS